MSSLKERIDVRWSPERVARGIERQRRAREILRACGHPARPHDVESFAAGPEENVFDFAQLPETPRGL